LHLVEHVIHGLVLGNSLDFWTPLGDQDEFGRFSSHNHPEEVKSTIDSRNDQATPKQLESVEVLIRKVELLSHLGLGQT